MAFNNGKDITHSSNQNCLVRLRAEAHDQSVLPLRPIKRPAGVFLDTLSAIAYKATKKTVEFVLPGFGKLVNQKREARTGLIQRRNRRSRFQPRPSSKFVLPGRKGRGFGGKEVVKELYPGKPKHFVLLDRLTQEINGTKRSSDSANS
jgi:hypothetical protein